jgi:glycosyltransferase involved in cell wall biosynthesis
MNKQAIDLLIPTYNRPVALTVTLTSIYTQTFRNFRVIISDKTESENTIKTQEIQAVMRVL